MSYFRNGDPLDDFDRLDQKESEYLDMLYRCEGEKCGRPIDDDHYFDVHGEILCEECMIRRYRRNTEDYINQ